MLIKSIHIGKTSIDCIFKSGQMIWRGGEDFYFALKQFNISSFKYAIVTQAASKLILLDYAIAIKKQARLDLEQTKMGLIKKNFVFTLKPNLGSQGTIPIFNIERLNITPWPLLQFSPSKNLFSWVKTNFISEGIFVFSPSRRINIKEDSAIEVDSILRFSKSVRGKILPYGLTGHNAELNTSPSTRIIILINGMLRLDECGTIQMAPSKRVIVDEISIFNNQVKEDISPSTRIEIKDYSQFLIRGKQDISPSTRLNIIPTHLFYIFEKLQSSPSRRIAIKEKLKTELNSQIKSSLSIKVYADSISNSLITGTGTLSESKALKIFNYIFNFSYGNGRISQLKNIASKGLIILNNFPRKTLSQSLDLKPWGVIKSIPLVSAEESLSFPVNIKGKIISKINIKNEQSKSTNLPAIGKIFSHSEVIGLTTLPSLNKFINKLMIEEQAIFFFLKGKQIKNITLFKNNTAVFAAKGGTKYIQIKNPLHFKNYSSFVCSDNIILKSKNKSQFLDFICLNQGKGQYIKRLDNLNSFSNMGQLRMGKQYSNYSLKAVNSLNSNSILSFSDSWQYPVYYKKEKRILISQAFELSYIEEDKVLTIV